MKTHKLQVNEPYEFSGPEGKREFIVEGLGIIQGPNAKNWGKEFYLVNVQTQFKMDGETVEQFICSPRYEGDTMDMIINSECTVGIARVKEGVLFNLNSPVEQDKVVYCAIGSIKQNT